MTMSSQPVSGESAPKIVLASDHGGVELKSFLGTALRDVGYKVHDLGPHTDESVDYPDYADRLVTALQEEGEMRGILICGSGIGISIAANRYRHIRAALCTDVTMAKLSRQHNNANVLALGARLIGIETAKQIVETFLTTDYEGGRHDRRIEKMS